MCYISWQVTNQINNEKFIIEHSTSGKSFQTIGKISGDGDHSGIKKYEYVHDTPSKGINYYRVQQVDYDGQYEYSRIVSVTHQTDEFHLYPNPTSDKVIISAPHEATLNVYNQLGMQVKTVKLGEGENEVDMAEMKSGIYVFRTNTGVAERVLKD
jgi:hypothetical protein